MKLYHVSKFTAPIYQQEKAYLFQGRTLAVDVGSKQDIEPILAKACAPLTKEELIQNFPEHQNYIEMLIDRGYLTAYDDIEECALRAKTIKRIQELSPQNSIGPNVLGVTFCSTMGCNFGCPYCFHSKAILNSDIVVSKELVKAFFSYMASGKTPEPRHLTLYGGEPLQEATVEIIPHILAYASKAGFSKISIITNGYCVHKFHQIFSKNRNSKGYEISMVQITLDGGVAEYHNKTRCLKRPPYETFDRIVENIQWLLNEGVMVVIRSNIDNENFAQVQELKKLFEQRGWDRLVNFSSYTNVVKGKMEMLELKNRIASCLGEQKLLQVNNYGFYPALKKLIQQDRIPTPRLQYCSAISNGFLFAPHENPNKALLFPCWECPSFAEQAVGEFTLEGMKLIPEKNKFWTMPVTDLPRCVKCPYALLHGGGCKWRQYTNDSPCDNFPELFRELFPKMIEEQLLASKK